MAQIDPKDYFKCLNAETIKNFLLKDVFENLRQQVFGFIKGVVGAFESVISNLIGQVESLISTATGVLNQVRAAFGKIPKAGEFPTLGEIGEKIEGEVNELAGELRDKVVEAVDDKLQALDKKICDGSEFSQSVNERASLAGFKTEDLGVVDKLNTSGSIVGNAIDEIDNDLQGFPGDAEQILAEQKSKLNSAVSNIGDKYV
jgi:phage-related protein